MSTVLRPQGPQKPAIYWRRRAVVLLVALVLPLTLGYLLFSGGNEQTQAEEPRSSAAPSPQDDDSASSNSSAAPDPTSSAQASPKSTVPACQDSDLVLIAGVDQENVPAGANPQVTLTIRSNADADCLRDIGSGANEIVVTSGGEHVWSSDDCDPSQASNEQLLPAGAEAQVTVTWERKLSAPGCAGEAIAAQPGTYQVEVRNGEVVSDPVRIVLQ